MMVEEKLRSEDFKALKEAAKSDPSVVVEFPPRPTRHRKWKEGRKKKGKYLNEEIAVVAKRIVSTYNYCIIFVMMYA